MKIGALRQAIDIEAAGEEIYGLIAELYPICRSITGNGVRQTLARLARHIDLTCHEVPTGTRAFDWTVPREWNITDAWVKTASGERVVDFRRSNLHVLHYSVPVRRRVGLDELKQHLHSLPEHPQWIPFRSSYYEERWGFCIEHERLTRLGDEEYEVCIESRLEDGSLTYGECAIAGASEEEFLFSCHVCHPSLCNDNLSGVALATYLAKLLAPLELRYSYRFLFVPGTIGSITWLSRNEERVSRIRHGLVVACVGDAGTLHYKRSRRGAEIDRAVEHVLRHCGAAYEVRDFSPYGYDERQYCSPGFDLPVGSLTRTPHGCFPEYHTSADDLSFVAPRWLGESLRCYLEVIDVVEGNRRYANTNPKCEPQLGTRGLYGAIGGLPSPERTQMALLWVLNLSDGRHDLLAIAERAALDFGTIRHAAELLCAHGLLEQIPAPVVPGVAQTGG
jgi:aminopeptidase-like protein